MSGPLRVLLTGGGTGGHVYPALAVAASAAETGTAEFRYVGTAGGMEADIVRAAGLPFTAVQAGAVRGRTPIGAAIGLARTVRGIAEARAVIRRFRPDVVLATGGFVCVPVVLAARLSAVPSVVYLPDLRPGWAVRLLARVAAAVAVSFEEVRPFVPGRRVVVTGYPVRPELLRWTRPRARRSLGFPEDEPVLLVMGGSRGARTINEAVTRGLERLLTAAWVIHATGTRDYPLVAAGLERLPDGLRTRYRVYPYLDSELAPCLAAASLVAARAGASTLGELPAVGAPGLLVPYPHAGAHQWLNARFLAERGAARIVEDAAARHGALVEMALALLGNRAELAAMAEAARRLARPDAAARLFQLAAEVAQSPSHGM